MAPTIVSNHHLHAFNILNANSLHFITLTLFFLPLNFLIHLHLTSGINLQNLLHLTTLFTVIISTITGISSTTYTAHQAILRKPITFKSTFKSLSHSFIPLLTTLLIATIIPTLASRFTFRFHLSEFTTSCLISFSILFHLVIWGLSPPIAVLERKSFYKSLRETGRLSENFLCVLFGNVWLIGGIIVMLLRNIVVWMNYEGSVSSWLVFVQVGVKYSQFSLMLEYYFVVVTLLYVRAKAVSAGGHVVVRNVIEDLLMLKKGGFSNTLIGLNVVLVISMVIGTA